VRLEYPLETGKTGRGNGFTGPRYVNQVLEGPLYAFLDHMEEETGKEVLVVEDGAPYHYFRVAKAYCLASATFSTRSALLMSTALSPFGQHSRTVYQKFLIPSHHSTTFGRQLERFGMRLQ
jgi:hypothetical protein